MLLPIKFVNSYLKKPLSTDEIVDVLERTEVEVEEVLSSVEFDAKILTAKVLKVWQHPNADRLRMAEIDCNKTKSTVVCGAPNLAEGLVVAYAQPGTILPDGTKIEHASIRGEKSAGMLCSAKELGLSDDHTGILELDPDLPLGISLCDIENTGDVVDIKTPANRWDMLSVFGLAREISANSPGNQLVEPKLAEIAYENREVTKVKEIGECKRFVTLKLSIKKNAKSPDWLVENLLSAGIKSIHPVVDITNFVLLETGQPSHAYDAAKLTGGLQVRFAKAKETLTTLDGVRRELTKSDLAISDNKEIVALAGVMGGLNTEVDEKTDVILLEVAQFNKTTIRRSALRHGIRTEASSRFEKGLPLPLQDFATRRLLYLFEEICGATLVDKPNDQLFAWPWVQHIGVKLRTAERFLGLALDEKQVIEGLQRRGFAAEHFSITKEVKKHLGKPYKWGANFKQDGESAFDCGYLVDYVYSLIGKMVGHQCLELFESGTPVELNDLKPGDAVFRDGPWEKLTREERKGLSHVGIYIGNGRMIHAEDTYRDKNGDWKKYPKEKQMVLEESVDVITKDPDYRGARRYVDNFNHIIAVTCPWWREDVKVEQDVYEEIAKIVGYENLPTTLPSQPPMNTQDHQFVGAMQTVREDLVSRGLFEVMTYSFVGKKHLELAGADEAEHLKIVNPLSIEQEYLRSSLLSSHLQVVKNNKDFFGSDIVGLFEFSRVYTRSQTKSEKDEKWNLGITIIGENSTTYLKGFLDMIAEKYRFALRTALAEDENFVPGRYARLQYGKSLVGQYGQVNQTLLQKHKIVNEVSFAELEIDSDLLAARDFAARAVARYQYIERDMTLELDRSVWWQDVVDSLGADPLLVKIRFLNEYTSEELKKKNLKRLSLRVWLDCGAQPSTDDIDKLFDKYVNKLLTDANLKKVKLC